MRIKRKSISCTCISFIAAHCLKLELTSNDTIPPTVLVVALGRFNLHEFREEGTINREVASYRIHQDYAHSTNGDSDLAVLILRTPIVYNPFIRPVCLWSQSSNLQEVVNKVGYVVGWGQDESGNPYTEEPRMSMMPIVSAVRILRKFFDFPPSREFCYKIDTDLKKHNYLHETLTVSEKRGFRGVVEILQMIKIRS